MPRLSRVAFEERNAPMRFPVIGFLDSAARNRGWLRHVLVYCRVSLGPYTFARKEKIRKGRLERANLTRTKIASMIAVYRGSGTLPEEKLFR